VRRHRLGRRLLIGVLFGVLVMAVMGLWADGRALAASLGASTLAAQPGIVGVHWCLGDTAASAIETNEKKSQPTRALAPSWVVMVEGATDVPTLEHACGQVLPRQALVDAGAIDPLIGLYQFQFQPGAPR
jgi:hypothetical protein